LGFQVQISWFAHFSEPMGYSSESTYDVHHEVWNLASAQRQQSTHKGCPDGNCCSFVAICRDRSCTDPGATRSARMDSLASLSPLSRSAVQAQRTEADR